MTDENREYYNQIKQFYFRNTLKLVYQINLSIIIFTLVPEAFFYTIFFILEICDAKR